MKICCVYVKYQRIYVSTKSTVKIYNIFISSFPNNCTTLYEKQICVRIYMLSLHHLFITWKLYRGFAAKSKDFLQKITRFRGVFTCEYCKTFNMVSTMLHGNFERIFSSIIHQYSINFNNVKVVGCQNLLLNL